MKIRAIKNDNPVNFKAREFAKIQTNVRGIISELQVLEIDDSDVKFLDLMSSKISLKKLAALKNATRRQYEQWKAMIDNAILMAGFNEPQKSLLLTKGNRACGIMSYKNVPQDTFIDYIATWPIAKDENVQLAGKSLVKALYFNAEKENAQKISLSLLDDSPVDLTKFYEEVGMKKISFSSNTDADMFISRTDIALASKRLDEIIKIEPVQAPKDINLKKILDIRY